MIVKKIKTTGAMNWLARGWEDGKRRFYNYFKNGGDDFLYVLNSVSLFSLLLLGVAMAVDTFAAVPPWLMSCAIFVAIFLGLYVFVAIVEKRFNVFAVE